MIAQVPLHLPLYCWPERVPIWAQLTTFGGIVDNNRPNHVTSPTRELQPSLLCGRSYGVYNRRLSKCPSMRPRAFKSCPSSLPPTTLHLHTLLYTYNSYFHQNEQPPCFLRRQHWRPARGQDRHGALQRPGSQGEYPAIRVFIIALFQKVAQSTSHQLTTIGRPLRTSAPFAPVRRVLASLESPSTTRALPSTASSPSSCFRAVTSPAATYVIVTTTYQPRVVG
jgi:hypothetical protein